MKAKVGDIIVFTCKCHFGEIGIVESANDPYCPSVSSSLVPRVQVGLNTSKGKFEVIDHIDISDAIHVVKTVKDPSLPPGSDPEYYYTSQHHLRNPYTDRKGRPYMIKLIAKETT